ncbi:MAG TPA: hotdog domain-containing protein [Nocardioides sp.]|uniref:thioesterase family protein n=1 Tax=Nocardioides sp. TaxID=35761 RepID=UPI002D808B6C|nr:hotdog domain-containing protein [Nocardioides sp.]HET6652119.1 hotdog domain-containing protein [Nocardioides sp.]
MTIEVGRTATLEFTVSQDDTAAALGSGDLPVLGTPRLLAWAEAATCAAIAADLDAASSSVGTRIQLDHVAASPVGAAVSVTATTSYADGRLVRFEVVAEHEVDGAPKVVGHGEVTRVVVDRERFIGRL